MIERSKSYLVFLFTLTLLFNWSCTEDEVIPDVSDIAVDLKVHRFEQELFAVDTNNTTAGVKQLEAKYPSFTDVYFGQILQIKRSNDTLGAYRNIMKGFLQYPIIQSLYDTCQIVYGDFSDIEQELTLAFQYYQYYFPNNTVPEVYTFLSEYGVAAGTYEDQLLIGLDMFLGAGHRAYYHPDINLPRYLTRTLDKQHLSARAMKAVVSDLVGTPTGTKLLDQMIHNGKQLYILDKLMPYTPDSILLEYTQGQVEWCQNNEQEMWQFFISENHLYSNNQKEIRKYIDRSPNAPGMPPKAPGRTANYIGWQIIKRYMQRLNDPPLMQLVVEKNAQTILNKSKYKPSK